MKSILVLLTATLIGCSTKTTNHIEMGGLVIDGENLTVSGSVKCDTVYIHDTTFIRAAPKSKQVVLSTHGDNSPAVISDKPVNIKY